MKLREINLFWDLITILRNMEFIPLNGISDVEYVTDFIGLDMYLSFIDNKDIKKLKNKLPKNTLFLFSERFAIQDDVISINPKIVGVFTNKKIVSLNEIISKNNKYIYEIR